MSLPCQILLFKLLMLAAGGFEVVMRRVVSREKAQQAF